MPGDELAGYDGVVAIGGDGCARWGLPCLPGRPLPRRQPGRTVAGASCLAAARFGCFRACRLFHEIINGLLELRSIPTGTTLDQQQWDQLQQHLEEAAAADAAAAASSAAEQGAAGGQQDDAAAQQQAAGGLFRGNSFGLPTSARHQRGGGAAHHRVGSIAASLRVGHIPAGSTDAVACTLNGTRSAFTAAMHIALGDACPLDVLRVDEGEPGAGGAIHVLPAQAADQGGPSRCTPLV